MLHSPGSNVAAYTHESSLLLTLEEISQLISHSHKPEETLENIVRLIQGRFRTDVSSVYLIEPESGSIPNHVEFPRQTISRVADRVFLLVQSDTTTAQGTGAAR